MLDGLNEQVRHEFISGYLYLSMAAYCESLNLPGFAKWLRLQWHEELEHGMKLYEMIHNRGGRVTIGAIDKPQAEWKSVSDIFQNVLAHEQKVTAMINSLYGLAVKEGDYASQVELQWFVKEQIEEEKNAADIIAQLKMLGESGTPLLMLDRALGARGAKG
jgi:ferritin